MVDLDAALPPLYDGPLDEFVGRRDALARELREAGQKDEAALVKKLRKPSRMAWSLNAGFYADPVTTERVAAAVRAMVEAQAGRGDVREATKGLRDAIQAAASVAGEAGAAADRSTLVPALMAVVSDAQAFVDLRRGRLTDIPTGGGLDALTDPPDLTVADLPPALSVVPDLPARPVDQAGVDQARSAVDRAEAEAASARAEADAAEADSRAAGTGAENAEQALRRAEAELVEARNRLRGAQKRAKQATTAAREAERAAAKARSRLQSRLDGR